MISTLLLLRDRRVEASASRRRTKQSWLLIVFSPMHTALVKRLAVDFGSMPCRPIVREFDSEIIEEVGMITEVFSKVGAAYNGVFLDATAEVGVVGRHGDWDEGRAHNAQHKLELGVAAKHRRGGAVVYLGAHPRHHVGAASAEVLAAIPGAATANKHLLRNGHLEHCVEAVFTVEVGAQLPHRRS